MPNIKESSQSSGVAVRVMVTPPQWNWCHHRVPVSVTPLAALGWSWTQFVLWYTLSHQHNPTAGRDTCWAIHHLQQGSSCSWHRSLQSRWDRSMPASRSSEQARNIQINRKFCSQPFFQHWFSFREACGPVQGNEKESNFFFILFYISSNNSFLASCAGH